MKTILFTLLFAGSAYSFASTILPTSENVQQVEFDFELYLVPGGEKLVVEFGEELNEDVLLKIFDAEGNGVQEVLLNKQKNIVEFKSSPTGMYFYELTTKSKDAPLAKGNFTKE